MMTSLDNTHYSMDTFSEFLVSLLLWSLVTDLTYI